ncbi:MAG: type IV secretory system conjugative DNA transfer family protein, partial [Actinomycetota bacterium]|nr:type IV secretory system conjugative DNA transfer family protein [Actinomycetota bacterium]
AVVTRMGHRHEAVDQRRRVGVETQARLARARDLRPLLSMRPKPGRFVVARWGRRYLSTEANLFRRRRGVRGAVAIFGPSQSGKTTGLITGVNAWDGPAIVSSVKTDLMRATMARRSGIGDLKVFDPAGISGMKTATWSPLRAAGTLTGAVAAAQMLARSGARGETQHQFWQGQAEQLLAGMLWTAANTKDHSMRHVVKWVLELDRPGPGDGGTLAPLVRLLTDSPDSSVADVAREVQGWLHGQWRTDDRTTSNVYATARNAVWPWADPKVAESAAGCDLTLDWLLDGPNTLYLCAPLGDETRIGAVFAVLLHDLVLQAFDRANRMETLDPRLLVLLDEAANTALPKLPEWASTVTGAGIQLVTVWQSKAQLEQIYARHAENVLTNHRTKLIYPSGLSDMATIEYVSALIGTEHVRSDLDEPRWSGGREHPPARSPSTAVPLLPASVLRRMRVGDSLLFHGELPAAWIRGRSNASRARAH